MGLTDPHDRRTFRRFAKLAPDGTVTAIVEVSDQHIHDLLALDAPLPGRMIAPDATDAIFADQAALYVDVTEIAVEDVDALTVDTALVTSATPNRRLLKAAVQAAKAHGR